MLPSDEKDLPLITIGVVVLNREWIIRQMLSSLQSQVYPHNRLYLLIVDGKSKDNTVKIAKEVLAGSDFNGYEVLVKESSIPEARNICIQKMKGDYLFFWDSDVIMEPTALTRMLETLRKENVDIVLPSITPVFVDKVTDMEQKWKEWETKYPRREESRIVQVAGTSDFLISKNVLKQVAFDPDLTFFEDQDFSSHATRKGFKILLARNIIGFDVKSDKPYSDIYFDMSLRNTFRGLRKKAAMQAQTITKGTPLTSRAMAKFLWGNKRYLFYIGYIPAIALTAIGILLQNLWLTIILPLYFLLYAIMQFKKRGFARGLKALMRSLIVGVPTTYALLYYCLKLSLKKPKKS